jgi:hypothetical protein
LLGYAWRAYTAPPKKYDDCNGQRGLFAMKANRLGLVARARARAAREEFNPADYSFAVKLRGTAPKPWRWEIYCAGHLGPVERSPIFFESMGEAAKAGKKALTQLLAKRAA